MTLIGDEPHFPYERPALSKELLTDSQEPFSLTLGPEEFWSKSEACDRIIAKVKHVYPGARRLTLDNNHDIDFDVLVIASGGQPRMLDVPGVDLPGVHTLRTIDDSLALKKELVSGRHLVVIGAGVIGMEVAASAIIRGLDVTVLEYGDRILARCLPDLASSWLHTMHESKGVVVHTGINVESIKSNSEGESLHVYAMDKNGSEQLFSADLILVAVGIDCDLDYLDGSGVVVDNGVLVDSSCRSTSMPWVYAAGDVANTPNNLLDCNLRLENWRNAENQARAVAEFICNGRVEPYLEIPWMWTDQYEHNIQVIGIPDSSDEVVMRGELQDGSGSLIWLRNGYVSGGVLINSARDRRPLEELVRRKAVIDKSTLQDASLPLRRLL